MSRALTVRGDVDADSGQHKPHSPGFPAYEGSNPTPDTTCGNGPLAANSRGWRAVSSVSRRVSSCTAVGRCVAVPTDVALRHSGAGGTAAVGLQPGLRSPRPGTG